MYPNNEESVLQLSCVDKIYEAVFQIYMSVMGKNKVGRVFPMVVIVIYSYTASCEMTIGEKLSPEGKTQPTLYDERIPD